MSTTSEFNSVQKRLESIAARNVSSTTRRKYERRKVLDIKPLRLSDIERDIQEAEIERLQESRNEKYPAQRADSIPEEPKETEANKENYQQLPEDNHIRSITDSFDLDLPALSLETPAKYKVKPNIKPIDIVTPKLNYKPVMAKESAAKISNRMLDFQFITPNNKIPPKIQCSVNMQPHLRTPLERLQSASKCNVKKLEEKPSCEDFKTIHVNGVEYLVLNELGKGGSSEVFQCYNMQHKTHRAIKVVSLKNPDSATGFINEVQMLKLLQKCDRIVTLFDFEIREEAKTLFVVLEVGGADLAKILKQSAAMSSHMPMYMLIYYWMEMLYAVRQIHKNGIIHSDLKPANFLKTEGFLKLIDFGIASCIQSDMTSVIKAIPEGSFNYISPEALNNESTSNETSPSFGKPKYKISFKSDVWSLGCILYQMVYRRTPFQHLTQMWTKLSKILDPNHEIEYPAAPWVPQKIINTIKQCLQYNMRLRPSVEQLIQEYETMFSSFNE